MPDLEKLNQNKQKIISVIQSEGPSFPARIARETQISPLFVSALMAELVSENKLKMSKMKVGSSPLYLLNGQEERLEGFSSYLNQKEKEAFELLKSEKVLEDVEQDPAIRVALRKISDFAFAVNVRIDGEIKTFWKYFSVSDEEAKSVIQSYFSGKTKRHPEKDSGEHAPKQVQKHSEKETKKAEIRTEQKKKPRKHESEFANSIKDYLSAKDVEILESFYEKKKEYASKIRTDSLFGKQELYLIAKDKKKISENDLTIALQKAQTEKMPALIISPGELDKKAKEYIEEWKNMVKFERIKL